jgi:hypothetical protein
VTTPSTGRVSIVWPFEDDVTDEAIAGLVGQRPTYAGRPAVVVQAERHGDGVLVTLEVSQ